MEEDDTGAQGNAAALDKVATLTTPEFEPAETPDTFLVGVAKVLQTSIGVDTDLAAILSDHLLTSTPDANAVVNAKAAIVALAAKRASSGEEQANG